MKSRIYKEALDEAIRRFEVERKKTRADNVHEKTFTLEVLLEQYLIARGNLRPGSALGYRTVAKNWIKFFGQGFLVKNLTLNLVGDYRRYLEKEEYAVDTQSQYLKSLKIMLTWAKRAELIDYSPVLHFDVPAQKTETIKWWTAANVERVLNLLKDRGVRYGLALTVARTGQRINSTVHLKWSWIKFDRSVIVFDHEYMKGRKNLTFPMAPDLHGYLWELRQSTSTDAEFVFSDDGGKTPILEPRYALRQAVGSLGLKGHWHLFRHSFCTNFLLLGRRGVRNNTVESLTRLMGWSSMNMALKYAHVSDDYFEMQREAVKAMSELGQYQLGEIEREKNFENKKSESVFEVNPPVTGAVTV
ncbi:MAG: site-specific integrase [Spirochaetia bacterium]|nr:site-specific integrase [Spirochaetia bacterium]